MFVAACIDAVKTGYVDGCFIDRGIDGFPTDLSDEKQQAYDAGHTEVLYEMQRQISKFTSGPLLVNHAYNLSGINSVQIENFGRDVQTGWVGWNSSMEQLRESVANGKLVEAHIPCAHGTMEGCTGDITDTLAAFLVVAGHQSYYGCGPWHCGVDAAENITRCGDDPSTLIQFFHDDYSKPLGQPLGEAEWEGAVLVRKFAHGTTVRFDTSSHKGQISWGSFDIMLDDAAPADNDAPAGSYRTAPMPSKTDDRDSAKRAPGFFLLDPAVHKMALHETYDWAVNNAPFVDLPGMQDVEDAYYYRWRVFHR
eukprot:COSAG06_NODE_8747_length_2080_cov_1.549218_2_plen_308_part_01